MTVSKTWTEWRIVAKKPGAKNFTNWVTILKDESVAAARLVYYRSTAPDGWEFKKQSRTVTQETTDWR